MLRALILVLVPVTLLMWLGGEFLGSRSGNDVSGRMDAADQQYLEAITGIDQEWNDALQLALATTRLNLADQVASLQGIRRRLSALEPGKCTAKVHRRFKAYQQLTIDHFLTFMREGEEPNDSAEIARLRQQAEQDIEFCLGNYIEQGSPEPPVREIEPDVPQQDRINEIADKYRKENPIN